MQLLLPKGQREQTLPREAFVRELLWELPQAGGALAERRKGLYSYSEERETA